MSPHLLPMLVAEVEIFEGAASYPYACWAKPKDLSALATPGVGGKIQPLPCPLRVVQGDWCRPIDPPGAILLFIYISFLSPGRTLDFVYSLWHSLLCSSLSFPFLFFPITLHHPTSLLNPSASRYFPFGHCIQVER